MEINSVFDLEDAAERWCKQIKAIPSFTESDSEQFKYDLLDMADGLKLKGLNDEEAFIVASERYTQMLKSIEDDLEAENIDRLQLRRITQGMSGVMVYFLLFFTMQLTSKLLFLKLSFHKDTVLPYVKYIYYPIYSFHLLIALSAIILYFFGKKVIAKIEPLIINPVHTLLIFLTIICLAGVDQWLLKFITHTGILSRFNLIQYYSSYSFSFVFVLCFLLLYKKYYVFGFSDSDFSKKESSSIDFKNQNLLRDDQTALLKETGLSDNEILLIGLKRQGHKLTIEGPAATEALAKASWRALLFIFSGVLLYFLIYLFLQSSARILLSVLQSFKHDAAFSIRWTWFYTTAFQLLIIFFTTSLLIRDFGLIQTLKKIKIKPVFSVLIFITTIIFAFIERYFLFFSRQLIGHVQPAYFDMERIFFVTQFTFPFLASVCFLVLYFKYYKENIKTS